jgi:hypothetical protein
MPLPSEPWQSWRPPLPAGVKSIGTIVPEILNRYGLSIDELDECLPQLPVKVFVSIVPRSNLLLELRAEVTA